jgi:hypothetical protein
MYKYKMKQNNIKLKMNRKTLLIPLIIGILIGINLCITLISAVEPYYDPSTYGSGFEGIINYDNLLVDGYFAIAFIAFIGIITYFGLTKANYNEPTCLMFAFFMALLTSMFFSLFTHVGSYIIFICAIGLGGSIFWTIIKGRE